MSFIKILSRLANLKYFPLVLSLMLIIPFTLLPIIPFSHLPILSLTLLLIISFSHISIFSNNLTFRFKIFSFSLLLILSFSFLPIISDAWAATYYVYATNGNDRNNGTSPSTPWKTIAKVNASRFQPGNKILFERGEGRHKVKPLFYN